MDHAASTPWTPYQTPRQQMRRLLSAEGHAYDIVVATPDGPAPAQGFASILVLDGGRYFPAVAAGVRALSHRPQKTGVEPLVVIGVCHDEADGRLEDARARDFPSTPSPEPGPSRPEGQGDAFRRFLTEEVLSAAGHVAPLDPGRRTLFGHSLGGLFVIETREARPDLFARWISISPSLWWRTPDALIAGPEVLVGYGEAETRRDMRSRIEAWAMAKADDRPRRSMAKGADHGSAPFALLPDALRHASSA